VPFQDHVFLNVMWALLIVFAWAIWFLLLIWIFADLFLRDDISGWAKAAWVVFVIVTPFVGSLVYLISQGASMAKRNQMRTRASQTRFDEMVGSAGATSSPTSHIESAKQLLDSGSITNDEFQQIKRRALGMG
jgi:uncharacterized membrane protein YcjF (UPF0283 family)